MKYALKNKNKSFSIPELLIAVVVFILVLNLASLSLRSIKLKQHFSSAINFYSAMIQIEDPNKHLKYVKTANDIVELSSEDHSYLIEFKNNKVIATTDDGGTMPLINDVKYFKAENKEIKIIFKNNEEFNARLLLKNKEE